MYRGAVDSRISTRIGGKSFARSGRVPTRTLPPRGANLSGHFYCPDCSLCLRTRAACAVSQYTETSRGLLGLATLTDFGITPTKGVPLVRLQLRKHREHPISRAVPERDAPVEHRKWVPRFAMEISREGWFRPVNFEREVPHNSQLVAGGRKGRVTHSTIRFQNYQPEPRKQRIQYVSQNLQRHFRQHLG